MHLLSNSHGNTLDDEDLIDVLSQAKATSEEVSKKVCTCSCLDVVSLRRLRNRALFVVVTRPLNAR